MHETYVTDETWAFVCRRCGHHWSVEYRVSHAEGFEGGEICFWTRHGLPSMAPDAGMPCPLCNGLRVVVSRSDASSAPRAAEYREHD